VLGFNPTLGQSGVATRANLQSYLRIVTSGMKWSTHQQHKEARILCEEGMTIVEAKSALSVPQSTK